MFNREAIFSCAIGLAATMLVACAVPNPRVGQNATVQFGVVRSAEPVTLNSAAAEGALIGGTLGLVAGRGQQSSARNAIVGAALGGAATAAAEGERQGMAYTVDILDGSSMRIVTDQREIQMGDCVAVERVRDTANIRRMADSYCDTANRGVVAEVSRSTLYNATACQDAKQELASAQTEAEADLAIRKIELLCS